MQFSILSLLTLTLATLAIASPAPAPEPKKGGSKKGSSGGNQYTTTYTSCYTTTTNFLGSTTVRQSLCPATVTAAGSTGAGPTGLPIFQKAAVGVAAVAGAVAML